MVNRGPELMEPCDAVSRPMLRFDRNPRRTTRRLHGLVDAGRILARPSDDISAKLEAIRQLATEVLGGNWQVDLEDTSSIRLVLANPTPAVGSLRSSTDRIVSATTLQCALQAGETFLGVVTVTARGSRQAFSAEDDEWLCAIADQIAVAVDYARLTATTALQLNTISAVLDSTHDIAQSIDVDSVLANILDRMVNLVSADTAGIWLVDTSTTELRNRVLSGNRSPGDIDGRSIAEVLARGAIRTGVSALAIEPSPKPEGPGNGGDQRIAPTLFATPLRRGQKTIGAVLIWTASDRSLSMEQQRLIEGLTDIAGIALAMADGQADRVALENQPRESQRMEAIGLLAGIIAHEFNNALTSISGFSQLASIRADDPVAVRNYMSEIAQATDRAVSLTNELLAATRR